jgi:hypothetical protein
MATAIGRARGVVWACAVLALLVFDIGFVKGYRFAIGDQHFYLPHLQAELDPSLYPDSTTIFRSTNQFSLFNWLFTAPARYLGLEWTFLLAYVLATVAFYFLRFALAERLTGDRLVAYGSLLLMLPWTTVGETETIVWDEFLAHRVVVLPLCLLALCRILDRKYVSAYFVFGTGALIHPITAAVFAVASFGALAHDLWRKFIGPRVVVLAGGAMLAGASMLFWRVLTSRPGDAPFLSPTTPEWVAIVYQRAPYMLPGATPRALWSWGAWFMLFFVAWFAKPLGRREDAVVMATVVTCGALLTLSVLVGSVMPVIPLARFEFARSLWIVILFTRIYLAAVFARGLTSGSPWRTLAGAVGGGGALSLHAPHLPPWRVAAVVCCVVGLVVWERSIVSDRMRRLLGGGLVVLAAAFMRTELVSLVGFVLRLSSSRRFPGVALAFALLAIVMAVSAHKYLHPRTLVAAGVLLFSLAYASFVSPEGFGPKTVHLPGRLPVTPWVEVQLWAREHTPRGAVFMAPWRHPGGFPIFSQRSTVADWESGGDVKFSYVFALRWRDQKNDLEHFDDLGTSDFCGLRRKYRFDYIVTKKGHSLEFPRLYENDGFVVYQVSDAPCREAR